MKPTTTMNIRNYTTYPPEVSMLVTTYFNIMTQQKNVGEAKSRGKERYISDHDQHKARNDIIVPLIKKCRKWKPLTCMIKLLGHFTFI